MTVKISGILKDALARPLANVAIRFLSLKTNSNIVIGVDTNFRTANDGSYTVDVVSGTYSVLINFGSYEKIGEINVYNDSLPGTLEDFLTIPGIEEVTPEILAQVIQARNDAINAANKAASDATTIIGEQLQNQKNEFDQFLLSSGYVFLGEYESGPFQFSARNQYIRYDGQYYRLNAATDVGFTTTGTDATSFANDVTHFVLMDGDTLRQNLGSGDGLKLVGRCADLTVLRITEPDYDKQPITLHRAVADGPELNIVLTYDAGDTTSADDGCSIFVTASGARWKADVSRGYNVMLAGFSPSENNMAQCINTVVAAIINQALARGDTAGGNNQIIIPTLNYAEQKSTYVMTDYVKWPTFVQLKIYGDVHFDFSTLESVTDNLVTIGNTFDGVTQANLITPAGRTSQNNGSRSITVDGGKLWIEGPGYLNMTGFSGLFVGNDAAGFLPCRDVIVENIRGYGCYGGINFGSYNTYINTVRDCEFFRNGYNLYQPHATTEDSGEMLVFDNVLFSDSYLGHAYLDRFGYEYRFTSACKFDYTRGDVFFLGRYATNCWISVVSSHIEAFEGMLVTQPERYPGAATQVTFISTQIYTRKVSPSAWAGPRQILLAKANSLDVLFIDSPVNFKNLPYQAYGALTGYGDDSNNRVRIRQIHHVDQLVHLPGYGGGINQSFAFSGTEGDAFTTDANTSIFAITTGGAVVTYGAVGDDGLRSIRVTCSATSDVVSLYLGIPIVFKNPADKVNAMVSVKVGSAVGNVNVTAIMRCLNEQTVSAKLNTTTNAITVTKTESVKSVITGDSVDVMTYLAAAGTPATVNDFVATEPLGCGSYYLGQSYAYPGIRVSGYTGTAEIKLPAFWWRQ